MANEEFLPDAGIEALKAELLGRIERNQRGKCTMRIRTLMDMFGYRAVQRLRQSSLLAVMSQLEAWGIRATLPDGANATDSITLTHASGDLRRPALSASEDALDLLETGDAVRRLLHEEQRLDPHTNPLAFAFNVADVPERERSVAICHDILASVWSFQPVCLHIEAPEEFFSFAVGFVSAVLRRRATMMRGQGH